MDSSPRVHLYVPPPPSPEAPAALEVLRGAPGPSPSFLGRPGTEIVSTAGVFRWQSAGKGDADPGKTPLVSPAGNVVAVSDFECYVKPFPNDRFLVWYEEDVGAGASMRFRLFNAAQLKPIPSVSDAYANLGRGSRFYAAAGEIASVALSTALDNGVHAVSLPSNVRDLGELLVSAHSTAAGRSGDPWTSPDLRLWILRTGDGRLEIVPQDWFNEGRYDFGYQWVARVARLPVGGAIVGEGIRLGVFKLDHTNRQIAAWLAEDKSHHP